MIVSQKNINEFLAYTNDFFVTSDTWFGRTNIIQIAKRPFKDINEMNNKLIKKWNSVVTKDDVVFHLGNFAWDPITSENVLRKLNGTIIFLPSNNDTALYECKTANISQESILLLNKFDVVLCHWPMKNWPGKDTGTVHFHGHEVYTNDTVLVQGCNVINTCTDFWDYKPIQYTTIKSIIEYKS